MRSAVILNVHVLILSVSAFVAAALVTTEKEGRGCCKQDSAATGVDRAAALLQAGQRTLHGDHWHADIAHDADGRLGEMSRAVEELDLHLAINSEMAELAAGPSAPMHQIPRKTAVLALTQRSSEEASDMSNAAEDLDLQRAIHAELAEMNGLKTHGQWNKSLASHQELSKEERTAGRQRAAALLQAGDDSLQDNQEERAAGRQRAAALLQAEDDSLQDNQELDLQSAIHAELDEINRLHTLGQVKKSLSPHQQLSKVQEDRAPGRHRVAALLQAGQDSLQGDQELDLQSAIHAELEEINRVQRQGQWKKSMSPHQDLPKVQEDTPMAVHDTAALLQAGHKALEGDQEQSRSAKALPQKQSFPLYAAGTLPGPHAATVALVQGSEAKSGNVSHAVQVVAVHMADFLRKTQVLEAPLVEAPAPLPQSLLPHNDFDAWTSEYMIFGRTHHVSQYFVKGFISVVVWAALTMLIGCFYHLEKQHPPQMDPEGVNVSLHDRERLDRRRWRFGLLECTEVPSLCLFSFFCAPIRWADTMRMAGFIDFFSALALVVGFTLLGSLTLGGGFLFLLGIAARFRHHMRKQFDIRSGVCGVYTDVLAYIFCPWCSIVQEARQVEEAYLARHASVRGEYIMARLAASKV